tara:strand:- start:837 stop:1673 length:837 start_codon:yes stop_codon:yes gene_type:complete
MKKLILPIFIAITTSLFFSCDKIDTPIAQTVIDDVDTTSTVVVRRFIMEEYTGHNCSNCPQGAAEMHRIDSIYGEQIIPVSLHAGDPNFNDPQTGSGSYETDFTTTAGDAYAIQFPPNGLPKGMVSRKNAGEGFQVNQWESEFLALKDEAPLAEITIVNTYNATTREVTIDIETEWLLDGGTTTYKLQVGIVEDHIIDWQLDGSTNVEFYDHRDVFRGAVNTTWGEAVSTTPIGSKDNKSYTYTLNAAWNADNCEVVAFIYKDSPDYEIMQANIKHVK